MTLVNQLIPGETGLPDPGYTRIRPSSSNSNGDKIWFISEMGGADELALELWSQSDTGWPYDPITRIWEINIKKSYKYSQEITAL